MELQKTIDKKINRKKFFTAAGISAVGFFVLRSFPFKLFERNNRSAQTVYVKINPQAVSRRKVGDKNV